MWRERRALGACWMLSDVAEVVSGPSGPRVGIVRGGLLTRIVEE